jgi:mitogen-activated protein kinase kinase kinase
MDMDEEGDWEGSDDGLGLVPQPRPSSRPNMRKVVNLHKSYKAKGFDINSIASPRDSSYHGRDSSQDLRASSGSPLEEENVPPDSARTAERIKWKKGELIGCGSYGRVFLGLNQSTGQLMAVKQLLLPVTYKDDSKISNANRKRLAKIEHEINLLRSMSCPHIVNYYGVQLDRTNDGQKTLDIFLEFVPGGSIASLLTNFGKFGESIARVYTKQILLGLRYLHRHEIVHRDIKGANILVDPSGLCKLADFGASSFIAELVAAENPSINGTISWMAPEVIRQESHGNKVDIWSVGCTVVEMLTGKFLLTSHLIIIIMFGLLSPLLSPLFSTLFSPLFSPLLSPASLPLILSLTITGKPPWCEFESGMAAMMHIAVTDQPPSLPCNLSSDGKDFMLRCFERDPRRRPSAAQLLRHPFVAEALDVVEVAEEEEKVSATTGSFQEGDLSLSKDDSGTRSEQTLDPAKKPPPRHPPPRHPQRANVSGVQTSDTVLDAPTFSLGASNAALDITDLRHEVPFDQPLVPVSNAQSSPALSETSAPSSADVTANVTISPNITFTPAASTQSSPDSPLFSLYSHQPHQSHQLRHSRHRSPPQGSHLLDDEPRLAHHQSPYHPPLGLVRSPKRGPETPQTSFRAPPSDFDLGPIETNRRKSRGPLDASEHDYRVQACSTSGSDFHSMHGHGDTGLEYAGRLRGRDSIPLEGESGGGESVGGGSESRISRPLLQSPGHDLIEDGGDGGRGSVEGLRVVLPPGRSSRSHMSPLPRPSGLSPNRLLQHSQQQQKGGEERLLTDRAKYER